MDETKEDESREIKREGQTVSIGTCQAAAGETGRGYLWVGTRPDDTPIRIPFIVVNGQHPGKTLVVDAAVHGDEHEGIVGLLKLVGDLDPKSMRGTLIAIPTVTVPAFESMQRGIPVDHLVHDPNRSYPGNIQANLTSRIAYLHFTVCKELADYHIALHSGASYLCWVPQIVCGEDNPSLALARSFGPGWEIVAQKQPFVGTGDQATASIGIPSITAEIGGRGASTHDVFERNTDLVRSGVLNAMRALGMIAGEPKSARRLLFVKQFTVRSDHGGILMKKGTWLPGEKVGSGDPLYDVVNLLGETVETVTAPVSGYVTAHRTYPSCHPGHSLAYVAEVLREEKPA